MTEGEPYYLEAKTVENGGGDHFSVAVEIEDDVVGHHHSMKEVQFVSMEAAQVFESFRINITNLEVEERGFSGAYYNYTIVKTIEEMAGGYYIFMFTDPRDLEIKPSKPIEANASPNDMKNAISSYY